MIYVWKKIYVFFTTFSTTLELFIDQLYIHYDNFSKPSPNSMVDIAFDSPLYSIKYCSWGWSRGAFFDENFSANERDSLVAKSLAKSTSQPRWRPLRREKVVIELHWYILYHILPRKFCLCVYLNQSTPRISLNPTTVNFAGAKSRWRATIVRCCAALSSRIAVDNRRRRFGTFNGITDPWSGSGRLLKPRNSSLR